MILKFLYSPLGRQLLFVATGLIMHYAKRKIDQGLREHSKVYYKEH